MWTDRGYFLWSVSKQLLNNKMETLKQRRLNYKKIKTAKDCTEKKKLYIHKNMKHSLSKSLL